MRILFASSAETPVPPDLNHIRAAVMISLQLADTLKKQGLEVRYLASSDSTTDMKLPLPLPSFLSEVSLDTYYGLPTTYRNELLLPYTTTLFNELIKVSSSNQFDLIHVQSDLPFLPLSIASQLSIPSVMTLHTSPVNVELETNIAKHFMSDKTTLVAISQSQKKLYSYIPIQHVIHHGVDPEAYHFNQFGGNNLLFVGRMKKDKGIDTAVQAALKTRHCIVLAGKPSHADIPYFRNEIQPVIHAYPEFVFDNQDINRETLKQFYETGKALLVPIAWEEPFGLVMIEAMAAGTPVIAFARGSAPEIVEDGKNGFLVNFSDQDKRGDFVIKSTGMEGFCEAIERMYSLPSSEYEAMRAYSRKRVEEYFNLDRMAKEYMAVYSSIQS